jgi:hypothetical protein
LGYHSGVLAAQLETQDDQHTANMPLGLGCYLSFAFKQNSSVHPVLQLPGQGENITHHSGVVVRKMLESSLPPHTSYVIRSPDFSYEKANKKLILRNLFNLQGKIKAQARKN